MMVCNIRPYRGTNHAIGTFNSAVHLCIFPYFRPSIPPIFFLMKRFLPLCLCLLLWAGALKAQQPAMPDSLYRSWTFGPRGGYAFSGIAASPSINSGLVGAPVFGVVMQYFHERHFGLQFECNYTTKGWQELNRQLPVYERQMDYLELPFLSHLYLGKRNVRVFLVAGPQLNILLDSRKEILGDLSEQRYDYYGAEANALVLDLAFGAGLTVRTKIGDFQLEGRGSFGMTDVLRRPDRSSSQRTNFLGFGGALSYQMPLHRIFGSKEKSLPGKADRQPDAAPK